MEANDVATFLRIVDFDKCFLKNRTRELKFMPWVAVPTKLDGDGYTSLVDHPNGAAHYGAWVALLLIAAKCAVRGTLSRGNRTDTAVTCGNVAGIPHDAASLSRISRIPQDVFEEAIPRLISIGWLETIDDTGQALTEIPQGGAGIPQGGAAQVRDACGLARGRDGTVRDVTTRNVDEMEQDTTSASADCRAKPDVSDVEAVVLHYQTYHPKARPGDRERKLVRARLKDGYTADDLCAAIDGNHVSPYHCGENDGRTEYHALELIVRNASQVQKFIELKDNPRASEFTAKTQRTISAAESYLARRNQGDGVH